MYIFFNFDHLRITLQSSDLFWGIKFYALSLLLPPLFFSYLQALIHGFLWWWASSWLIFSLKWHLQSSLFLLHSVAIHLQEAKDSIDEEDPSPTSSKWSYINWRSYWSWGSWPEEQKPILLLKNVWASQEATLTNQLEVTDRGVGNVRTIIQVFFFAFYMLILFFLDNFFIWYIYLLTLTFD